MKNHIIIELRKAPYSLPHWEELIFNKSAISSDFDPEVKRVFEEKSIKVWFSQEYKKAKKDWSTEEIQLGLNNVFRIIFQEDNQGVDLDLLKRLKSINNVISVFPGSIAVSDIPEVSMSQSLSSRHPAQIIGLKEAHNYSKGHPEIVVAVLDTGVDFEHPEIKKSLLPGMDFVNIIDGAGRFIGDHIGYDDEPFDEVGHGTHVSGILTAVGSKMPIGVVPNCRILPVRVLGSLKKEKRIVGAGLIDNINNGIKWAVDHKADIINMSLGIKHTHGGLPHEKVVRYAISKGVSIVAASGNDGQKDKYYPGALPGVTAVGASDFNNEVAHFSTYGTHVSLIAPGTHIYSTFPGGKYSVASGTSQAAPFVSGAIALLKSFGKKMGKDLRNRELVSILEKTADRTGKRYKDHKAGYGMINLLDALKYIKHEYNFSLN